MSQFAPGLLEIKGKRCLIIADSVSHELPSVDAVLLDRVEGFNIFCSATEMIEKRTAYHGVAVYGYWQTLHASKRWRPSSGVAAYRHHNRGQYVAVDLDEKTAITGEVVDGRVVVLDGEQFDQKQIQWLELETADIILPSKAAITMAERVAKQEKNNRMWLLTALCAVLALAAGWVSGTWFYEREAGLSQAQRDTLIAEIETARSTVSELQKGKLLAVPDQRKILNLLEDLSWIEGIEIPHTVIDAIQLSVPYQSYLDMIYVLAQHDILYTERWLAAGRVEVSLQ